MIKLKYTIEAYNNISSNPFAIDVVEVTMLAKDCALAISEAKKLITREEYIVTKIDVIEKDDHEYQIR